MKMSRLLAAAAAVSMLCFGLTACGSSDDQEATVSTPSGDPIKIGHICSCSGVGAAISGKGIEVMQVWVDSVNDAGGINGHPVELYAEDVGYSPEKALSAAKKLVEQDGVVAFVGGVNTLTAAYREYVEGKGIPVVGGYSYEAAYASSPNFFISGTGVGAGTVAQDLQIADAGLEKLGVMYCAEVPACAEIKAFSEKTAPLAELEITSASISATQPNYTAQCNAFKDEGVDALFIGHSADVLVRVVDDCAKLGFEPTFVGLGVSFTTDLAENPAFEGSLWLLTNANIWDESVPGVERLRAAVEKYNPELLDDPGFTNSTVNGAWVPGLLFEAASDAAGGFTPETTPAEIIAGLKKVKDEDLEGMAPPLTFTDGVPANPTCYFEAHLSDGQLVSDNEGKSVCLSEEMVANMAGLMG